MKLLYIPIVLTIVFSSCKNEKEAKPPTPANEQNILEKVAGAHGFKYWKDVNTIRFTFNVDRDTSHYERSWIWDTRNNRVTSIMGVDTLSYNRKAVDSTHTEIDASFVNDKYWMLAPYNLVWDQDNFSYEHTEEILAPLSSKPMQKLTIVYSNEGGYTPGDAYDFYFEDDFVIKEWSFRKANQDEPNLTTSWEAYESLDGLLISMEHHKGDGSWILSFSDVQVD